MTIRVVPTEFMTVQDAIDASSAGDSIQILAGTFDGFNVDKERLKIFGCGIGKTIIAGNSSPLSDNGIDVSSNQTILKGLTVQGFSEGDGEGIEITSNNNVLKEIEVKFNGDGFELRGNNNLIINCVTLFNDDDGFDIFTNTAHNCIIHCTSSNNKNNGFEITDESHTFLKNIAIDNTNDGFDVSDPFNTLFQNKSIRNGRDGISVFNNSNNIIGNISCNNVSNGIRIDASEDENVIDSNIVRRNGNDVTTAGILVESGSMDNVIRFNKVKNNIEIDIEAEGGVGTNIYDENKCESSSPGGLCT
ncbi:right-handed parallel beta-helix repeat-containing protein [Bacillus solimangrovi]|uniref:Right handed beta helix domain-containing protein n=1 Tax=Bacillus solimangrovi TaxID=1305675 RepID=A0A1E5LD66_9BACI|nr:right-handed parallel beta-helix repeat-containing protein [Bacillus solimangrovi]OEH92038.1 hypothetical protein BFG57_17110 [Bacillus solimangrovi]